MMLKNNSFFELSLDEVQVVNGGGGDWPWELIYNIGKDLGTEFYYYVWKPIFRRK